MGGLREHYGQKRSVSTVWLGVVQEKWAHSHGQTKPPLQGVWTCFCAHPGESRYHGGTIGDQRGPLRFHEEHLGHGGLGEECGQWPEGGRRARLTPAVIEPRTAEDHRTKERAQGAGCLFF